jgi:hypothetical protein
MKLKNTFIYLKFSWNQISLHSKTKKKETFPILNDLTQKYLAVSATLTANKYFFSDTGNLLTNKRTRMKSKLFKKIIFLKRNAFNFNTIHPID